MNFSEKARAMRMKSPLTLREIGEQCNASESMVSRYISGAAKPPDDVAEKILEVLRDPEKVKPVNPDNDAVLPEEE